MNSIGFALILGAVFGIISSLVVYSYDWRCMANTVQCLRERNAYLRKLLEQERAERELDTYWRKRGLSHEQD